MNRIKLVKPWGGHEAGTEILCDSDRAQALREQGFVELPTPAKKARRRKVVKPKERDGG